MRSSASRFTALALALALTASDSFAGGARIVDAPGLPPFYDLQDAVDAATDGDTILVAAGIYDAIFVEDLLAPNVGAGTPPIVDMGCYEHP